MKKAFKKSLSIFLTILMVFVSVPVAFAAELNDVLTDALNIHTCDFSGDWTFDDENHWKTCDCGEIGNESRHSFEQGFCECGYVCTHAFYEDKCSICNYEIGVIQIGVEKQVHINNYDSSEYFKFVAPADGVYLLCSSDTEFNDESDPYITFYDSEFNELYLEDDTEESFHFALIAELEEGKTYYLSLNTYLDGDLFNFIVKPYIGITHQPTVEEPYIETNVEGATYQWYIVESLEDEIYTKISGETKARLENFEIGKKYICEVTFSDSETIEMSDVLDFIYAITHHPTAEEPYVELNDDTDATYQWYTISREDTEITDENANEFTGINTITSYNEETGWTGAYDGNEDYNERCFFTIELKKMQSITVEFSGEVESWIYLYSGNDNSHYVPVQEGKRKYTLIAGGDDTYRLITKIKDEEVTVKAYYTEFIRTPVEGQTSSVLIPKEAANYYCQVVFADGTEEMSEIFSVTEIHTCNFAGEWKYNNEKHWKECKCGENAEEAVHSYIDGKCDCGYECSHEWDSVLTRPTETEKGYYTYTCLICEKTYTQTVENADYTEFNAAAAEFEALLETEGFLNNKKAAMMDWLNSLRNTLGYDKIEEEQEVVDGAAKGVKDMADTIEAGIADGSMIKADLTYLESLLNEINSLVDNKHDTIILSMFMYYSFADSVYQSFVNNPDTSQLTYDQLIKNNGYEEHLENLIKAIKDGTGLKADYTEIDKVIADIDSALENATISETMANELAEIKSDLQELKTNMLTSKADLAQSGLLEKAESLADIIYNCANGIHSFTKYEEVESPECGIAGKEIAECDNGCKKTDEREIPALVHKDNDGDFKCDNGCGYEFEKPAEPTPDEPSDGNCDHICHSAPWFIAIFWNIVKAFYKLFGINQFCSCGAAHY